MLLIIIVEIINTAIENTICYISLERNKAAKKVKYAASAAVFFAITTNLVSFLVILIFCN